MVRIQITKECHNAIRNAAELPFRDTAVLLPNGEYEIEIGDDLLDRINAMVFPGESISDVLLRGIAAMRGKPN